MCIHFYKEAKRKIVESGIIQIREPKPKIFQIYHGLLRSTTIFGVDAKQLINARIGMMLWQILIITYGFSAFHKNHDNPGLVVNILLQTLYIIKFYVWEEGYYNTLDVTMDNLGFYIVWGCLTFIPFLYTLPTYYMVINNPKMHWPESSAIMLFGMFAISMNYWVDYQKQIFIESGGKTSIWGADAKYIEVSYQVRDEIKTGKLLVSGFWGIVRHANYLFEIMLSIAWCLPAVKTSFVPFLYPLFIVILLLHRIHRDEKKCKEKYENGWDRYCELVKWKMIPYVF